MKVNLPENLKKAVKSKDLAAARSAILTEVRNDRMREEPRALRLADLASKELPGLYEPDNGFCSSLGDLDVSDDLWTKARSAMMLNFSRERLCFIEKIVRRLSSNGDNGHPIPVKKPTDTVHKVKPKKRVLVSAGMAIGCAVARAAGRAFQRLWCSSKKKENRESVATVTIRAKT